MLMSDREVARSKREKTIFSRSPFFCERALAVFSRGPQL